VYDGLSPVEKVLDRLKDYTVRKDEYRARCPAHNGNSNDSLSIKEGDDGRALLICHAHCEIEDILEALDLGMIDLFVKDNAHRSPGTARKARKATGSGDEKHKILTTDGLPDGTYWEFTSPAGEVLYVQRHKREYYRKVGEDRWVTYRGVLDDIAQVLYRLPELIDGVRAGKTVYHLEGPKDVETARKRLGVVATTSGSTSSWRPEFRTHYTGADVVVIPDSDAPGRKYADTVAR
jgi:putative DNA primase/helicase